MKKTIFLIAGLLILAAIAVPFYLIFTNRMMVRAPVLVSGDPRVNYTYGEVEKKDPDDEKWTTAVVGMSLPRGTVVRTGNGSKTDIRFAGSITVRLAENSRMVVSESNIKSRIMNLEQGSLYGTFKREHKDQEIKIVTPTSTASVRGTELGFEVFEVPSDQLASEAEEEIELPEGMEGTKPDQAPPEKLARQNDRKSEQAAFVPATRIHAISGIVEVGNTQFPDKNILLAYQNNTIVAEGHPPEDPVRIGESESTRLRNILNSIHTEEVLLISEKVRFARGSARLRSGSKEELDRIADILLERRERIRIEGHTDNTGTAHVNQRLSGLRAEAIKKYLVSKGVDEKRLEVKGYGSSSPVVPNNSEPNMAKNRRVEFIIIE